MTANHFGGFTILTSFDLIYIYIYYIYIIYIYTIYIYIIYCILYYIYTYYILYIILYYIYVEPIPWLTFGKIPWWGRGMSWWSPSHGHLHCSPSKGEGTFGHSWTFGLSQKRIGKAGDSQAWKQYSHLGWLGCWPIGSQHDQVDEEPSPFRLRCEAFCGSTETMIGWCHGLGPCRALLPNDPQSNSQVRGRMVEPWVIWMGWKKRSSSVTVPSSKWDRHASLLESIMQPTTLTPKAAWPWISQNPGSRHVSFPACDSAHNPVEPPHWASSISEWCAVGSWPTPGAKIEPEVLTTNAMQLLGGLHPAR